MSTSSAASSPSPLDDLASLYEEWKDKAGKHISIVRSCSAIVSFAASSLLVWILFRSRDGIKTTYRRLLLGLSVSDILFSLSLATFGALVPRELNYVIWNARGSLASCDAFGFIQGLGGYSGLLYMCSLNLYYLAKVKFNKPDIYIAKKLEPWLHLVPIAFGVIVTAVFLAKQGMNADNSGFCSVIVTYEPPHCDGYEDGDTPEGFDIPCGRGRSIEPINLGVGFLTVFLIPITIGGSLWTIYRSVSRAEQRVVRFNVGALQTNQTHPTNNDAATTDAAGGDSGASRAFSILLAIRRRVGGRATRTNSDNQNSSHSRAVLQRAAAYSLGYFVTWIWGIIYGVLFGVGAWSTKPPWPKWQIAYSYAWNFFGPLQGLWTFLIYMQPNIIKRKRSSDGNISWFRAFGDALGSSVTGRTNSAESRRDRATSSAPRTAAAPNRAGANPTPDPGPKGRNASAAAGFADQRGDRAHAEDVSLEAEDPEEEKREIQEYDPAV